jgi:radical SAM protein with 4Fe4S-binding SPASM domain
MRIDLHGLRARLQPEKIKAAALESFGETYARARVATSSQKRASPRPFPSRIAIEPASACNLECPMCPTPNKSRKNGIMQPDLFRGIIDQIAAKGVDQLFLHLWGEPLIHPHLSELISYARQYSSIRETVMSTNATLLTAERADKLLRSGLHYLIFSLDGATPTTYEALRLGARYDVTMANVAAFLEQRAALGQGPRVVFQIIEMQQTIGEIEAFRKRWAPLLQEGDEISVKSYNNWSEHGGALSKRGIQFRTPCFAFLWDFIAITWDGTVLPCCFDCEGSLPLGSLRSQTIDEIWNGSKLSEMRADHLALKFEKYPLCVGCDHTSELLDVARLKRVVGSRIRTSEAPATHRRSRDY